MADLTCSKCGSADIGWVAPDNFSGPAVAAALHCGACGAIGKLLGTEEVIELLNEQAILLRDRANESRIKFAEVDRLTWMVAEYLDINSKPSLEGVMALMHAELADAVRQLHPSENTEPPTEIEEKQDE